MHKFDVPQLKWQHSAHISMIPGHQICMLHLLSCVILHGVSKKQYTWLLIITLANVDRFFKILSLKNSQGNFLGFYDILKIDVHLPTLWSKVKCIVFFLDTVHVLFIGGWTYLHYTLLHIRYWCTFIWAVDSDKLTF